MISDDTALLLNCTPKFFSSPCKMSLINYVYLNNQQQNFLMGEISSNVFLLFNERKDI